MRRGNKQNYETQLLERRRTCQLEIRNATMELTLETAGYGENKVKDLDTGKRVLNVLEQYYAGHDWFVNCCHESGVCTIQLMYEGKNLETRIWKYGIVLHLDKLNSDNLEYKVRMAGGEVLE